MTEAQLEQIKQFAYSNFKHINPFHGEQHTELTVKYAMLLADNYAETNLNLLKAACYLHDIGRINVDEGHPKESEKLAKPFLEEIHIPLEEREIILHAIAVHDISEIGTAKTIEAKILFDADKIQQLSVYGFLRMILLDISVRKMDMVEAVNKRWEKTQKIWNGYVQTEKAKTMLAPEIEKIKALVQDFNNGLHGHL